MTQAINIDALLADSWLTVTELRLGAKLAEGEGKHLWQRCVDNIEQVMAQLVTADISEANRQHILYAWCALLDETATPVSPGTIGRLRLNILAAWKPEMRSMSASARCCASRRRITSF